MMSERKSKRNSSPENERKCNQMPSTSAHASTRITIEQKASNAKSIKCSVDPKDVIIKRRCGEGSKPLFSRDDILINPNRRSSTTPTRRHGRECSWSDCSEKYSTTTVNVCRQKSPSLEGRETPGKIPYFIDAKREADRLRECEKKRRRSQRIGSSSHSSEKYNKTTINTCQAKSHSPKGRKTPDKIPYFSNAKREEDRLRAKYEHPYGSHKTRSRGPPRRRSRTRSRSSRRIRPRSRRRSRPRYRSRSRSRSRRRHRSYDRSRRSLSRNTYRNRSSSRDRSRLRSPSPEQRYMPATAPMEYPYTPGWIPPPVHGYQQNPPILQSPPIPCYPLRPPFAPMGFPIRPPRPYRPVPPKQTLIWNLTIRR